MTAVQYDIELRNKDLQIVSSLTDWLSLTFVLRHNNIGTVNVEVAANSRIAPFIIPNNGIVLKRNKEPIFSGSFTKEYQRTVHIIKAAGEDDKRLLRTPARPTPTLSQAPYPDEYDVRTGQASSIVRDLVNANIGVLAPPEYALPYLLFDTDPHLGGVLTSRARLDPLLTMLQELCSTAIAGGLGFTIMHQYSAPTNTLLFKLYSPQDRSASAIFSTSLKTITDFTHTHQDPIANWFMIAGGDAFGSDRTIIEGGDDANIATVGRRIPLFVDARGTTDLGELEQKLAEQIATVVTVDKVDVVPDTTIERLQYGRDYDLGDVVTAVVGDTSYVRQIREITIDFPLGKGVIVTPLVADPNGTNDDIAAQEVAAIQDRMSNVERNWGIPNDSIIEDMLAPEMKWLPGDMKITGRSSSQQGWLVCDGTPMLRGVYTRLFAAIGTAFGVGDGTTTFNLPDLRGRSPFGAGGAHALGEHSDVTGGTFTAANNHSHGLNSHVHVSQAHTHTGSHSHGIAANSHTHGITHDHNINISTFVSGKRQNTSAPVLGYNEPAVSGGTNDHNHNVTIPSGSKTDGTNTSNTGQPGSFGTQPDVNVFPAIYTGSASTPSPSTTENDSNSITGTFSVSTPYQAVNYEIYTGIES